MGSGRGGHRPSLCIPGEEPEATPRGRETPGRTIP